jgi:hypothetical protein
VCQRCIVLDECRHLALHHLPPAGIWGGMTLAQRRQIIASAA